VKELVMTLDKTTDGVGLEIRRTDAQASGEKICFTALSEQGCSIITAAFDERLPWNKQYRTQAYSGVGGHLSIRLRRAEGNLPHLEIWRVIFQRKRIKIKKPKNSRRRDSASSVLPWDSLNQGSERRPSL
jgi:hypothetical protein